MEGRLAVAYAVAYTAIISARARNITSRPFAAVEIEASTSIILK